MGYKKNRQKFVNTQLNNLREAYVEFKPDIVLILDGLQINYMDEILSAIDSMKCRRIIWLWDSIKHATNLEVWLPIVDSVICFEPDEVNYINQRFDKPAQYSPLGYEEEYYYYGKTIKDIDISFIGNPFPERIAILDAIAEYAYSRKLNMIVGGEYYDQRHWWKRRAYKHKHDALYSYLINRPVYSDEAAEIYRRSKICLNISRLEHQVMNPRSFEIFATGSFQLLDRWQNHIMDCNGYNGLCNTVEDWLKKIDYYLNHDDERESIAHDAYIRNKKMSMSYIIRNYIQPIIEKM